MLIGYRCKVCGAPIDPETGYCQYCDTLNFKPIKKPTKDDLRRIIIRHGDKEALLKPESLSLKLLDAHTDIAHGRDISGRIIKSIPRGQFAKFSADVNITWNAIEILKEPIFDVVFTGFRVGYGHEFQAYASNIEIPMMSVNAILTTSVDIVSYKPVDLWNDTHRQRPIIEGLKCTICGADLDPMKSKCDYCGYWWMYSPEG